MEINKEAIKIIEENPVALSTCNDNKPNASVAAFVKVKDDKIIITNNYMGKTIDNIKENPKLCLVVWNKDWTGYKIEGDAEYFEEGEWFDFVKKIPENKDEPCKGAIVITINNIKEIG